MKVISLNVYGGRFHQELLQFFRENQDVDVFCLQEVYHEAQGKDTIWLDGTNLNALNDYKEVFPNHIGIYHPHLEDWWGLAMFVKKDISIKEVGEEYVHLHKRHNMEIEVLGHTAKNLQYLTTSVDGKIITVVNFHGLWNGQGKGDSEHRITQSQNIIKFFDKLKSEHASEIVFCGDFNLLPETESLLKIERDAKMRNLIKDFNISSTRSSHYKKPDRYADYALVSEGVVVNEFKVLPNEVSDHLALYIDFK